MVLNEFMAHEQTELLNKFVDNLQPELLADLVLSKLPMLPPSFEAAVAAQPSLGLRARAPYGGAGGGDPGRPSWLSEAKATLQAQASGASTVKRENGAGEWTS
jgi:hypothetical protein